MVAPRFTLAAFVLLLAIAPANAQPKAQPPKLGLLVGCTKYQNHPQLRTLYGPANDVKIWRETLTKGFGFSDANITTLAEWPDDVAKRPTEANIRKAFLTLIENASPGAQVVIVMSGHGMQVPLPKGANPLDPKNFEPDGMDEVFLPADVEQADEEGQLKNAITDNQFGEWLDQLRAKGTHVMIVFDCCHSGTMTRNAPKPEVELREISRVVAPHDIGIKQGLIDASVKRATEAVAAEEKRTGKKVTDPGTVKPVDNAKGGSLVAFYAAQPFEEAPELPLPDGVPLARENYYGLLSFTVLQSVKQRQSPLTYRELAQMVGSYYRAERGVKGPVPFAEGDLDREVLGYNVWPNRSDVILEKDKKENLSVNSGTLSGITEGSILAVHPPAGDARDPKTILGFVKVQSATVASAVVVPVANGDDKKPAVNPAELPNLARCTVAARDYGDMRVKLFLDKSPLVTAAFTSIAKIGDEGKDVLAMMRVVENEADAEWILRLVTPKEAEAEFGLKRTEDHVLLIRGAGRKLSPEEAKIVAAGTQRRVFGAYPVGNPNAPKSIDDLGGLMARDLPKLFRWQNLWRVASGTADARGGESQGLKFEVAKQPSEKAVGPGEILRSGVIPNNTILDFRVKNEGKQNLWVVAIYLDAELAIDIYDVVSVEAGKVAELTRGIIEKKPGEFGMEGMVIFALPQSAHPTKPNFKFLEQSPLKEGKKAGVPRGPKSPTPFEQLLGSSVIGAGSRAPTPVTNTTPMVISGSWVVVP